MLRQAQQELQLSPDSAKPTAPTDNVIQSDTEIDCLLLRCATWYVCNMLHARLKRVSSNMIPMEELDSHHSACKALKQRQVNESMVQTQPLESTV